LEVANSALGPKKIGLWHRTVDGAGGKWVQADRGAGAYLAGEPADDARFVAVFEHSLEHTGGYTREETTRVAETDTLFYDPARPASYPDNGRALSDDVMDVFGSTITTCSPRSLASARRTRPDLRK
jgi:hypothetical protein